MTGDIDTTVVIDDLLPALHAASRAELTWWTEGDLIQWMDEAVKRVARKAGVFVVRSTSLTSTAGAASYPLPQRHVATLHVTYGQSALRPAGTLELEARDRTYRTTRGTPANWYQDLQGDSTVALAKVPAASGDAIALVYTEFPPELDTAKSNTLLTAPAPFKAYLAMYVLAEAYGREGEMEMQDLAAHCRGRVGMFEAMLEQYYGSGD